MSVEATHSVLDSFKSRIFCQNMCGHLTFLNSGSWTFYKLSIMSVASQNSTDGLILSDMSIQFYF